MHRFWRKALWQKTFLRNIRTIFLILLFAVLGILLLENLAEESKYIHLDAYTWETDEFRSMDFGDTSLTTMKSFADENDLDFSDVVATVMAVNTLSVPDNLQDILTESWFEKQNDLILRKKQVEYGKLKNAYQLILQDLECFPIPYNLNSDEENINYVDSWGYERTYGGERQHEGTDIMSNDNISGVIPIVSMTDGVIESVGWLELGGWRLGVRTPSGAYIYYAHMYSYAKDFQVGDTVYAGQLLGQMGDSGYSTIEGTTGNFAVHLHVGIYIKTDHYDELSVNPYPFLKYLEDYQIESYY